MKLRFKQEKRVVKKEVFEHDISSYPLTLEKILNSSNKGKLYREYEELGPKVLQMEVSEGEWVDVPLVVVGTE